MKLKQSSAIRRAFERWLARKFIVRSGPVMYQRWGYWQYVDFHGNVYRLDPTYDEGCPLRISLVDKL